ncbi:MAG: phosphatidylglycerophosphatase A [Xanthomonadales bacterium]|nr:phosphatidylglycerophosphatase A [Xanthomonadales bacterium]
MSGWGVEARALLAHPLGWLALGFGAGLLPRLPGTAASALAWLGWLALAPGSLASELLALGLAALLAWAATRHALRRLAAADPGCVVADEWLGMWLALALAPAGTGWQAAAFVLFRVLDIAKPWPIARLERLPGATGVLADDLAAGLAAGLALALLAWLPGPG